ncbi:hypothetical protein ACPCI0_18080 [Streptomyces griseoincarnatus]
MEQSFRLGGIRCPSGTLVVIDGGHLGAWSGERSPTEIDPALLGVNDAVTGADVLGAVDFAVVGQDASEAVRSVGRQPGAMFHDVPASRAAELGTMFEDHCRASGLDARLEALPRAGSHMPDARIGPLPKATVTS